MASMASMDMSSMASNMPGMTTSITGSAPSSTTSSSDALSTAGMDMTNATQQMDFLMQILDDTELQVISNSYARRYWYGVVVIIALAALSNIVMRIASHSRGLTNPCTIIMLIAPWRLNATAAVSKTHQAAAPSLPGRMISAVTSTFRKLTYPQISPTRHSNLFKLPPLGIILLLLLYLAFVLALEFVKQDIPGEQHNQAIGVRAGWLTVTQLPLLILLSGKVNMIGLMTGVGYERLNVIHRWVARTMLLTATLHMGYQQALWNSLGLLELEWSTDTCPPTGIKAYAFLLWLNLSTLAPIRNLWYEFFVIQHILTFFGFIICIMLHLPSTALYSRVYIYIPIGLYLFERLLRTLRYTYNNIRPGRATLIHLPGGVTKIVVSMRQVKSWTPGSFVLLSLPRFGLGQSHPATIASVPSSHEGKLVFFLRAHHGFTSRVHANASVVSLQEGSPGLPTQSRYSKTMHLALIDGPYGGKQLDIAAYNSVLLIAGSTGVSFTLPILLDLSFRAQKQKLPVREVTFIWAIKTSACTAWISDELRCAGDELRKAGIDLNVRVFVTADEEFVEDSASGGEESRDYSTKTCHCKVECSCISNSPQIAPSTEPKILQPREEIETQSLSKVALDEKSKDQPLSYGRRGERLTIKTGRPDLRKVVMECQGKRNRGEELGVAVCGPIGLTSETRRVVAHLEGKGAGIYLHAESFGW